MKTDYLCVDYSVQPPKLVCDNCKESLVLNLPMSLAMIVTIMKQFQKEHKICGRKEFKK